MSNRFPLVNSGYDPEIVDATLEQMEEIIRSYKEKDAAIKNAILNAQIAADNIIRNAEADAEELRHVSQTQVEGLLEAIEKHRHLLDSFKAAYNQMIETYLVQMNNQDFVKLDAQLDDMARSAENLGGDKTPQQKEKPTPDFVPRQARPYREGGETPVMEQKPGSTDKPTETAMREAGVKAPVSKDEETIQEKLTRLREENERKLSETINQNNNSPTDDMNNPYTTQRPLTPAEILGLSQDVDDE